MGLGKSLLAICLFSICLKPVWSDAKDTAKLARVKAIQSLLVDLSSPDPRKRSEAAGNLGANPFVEVKAALLATIQRELKNAEPNSYVLVACLESLESMISTSDMPMLTALAQRVTQKKVSKQLEQLMFTCQNNPVASLPSLPKPDTSKESFLDRLKREAAAGNIDPEDYKAIAGATEKDISHDMAEMASDPKNPTIIGRDKEAEKVLQILVRIKSRIPVLVGRAGVGKTAVAEAISLMIQRNNLPEWFMYQQEFPAGTVVLQTSAARIGRLALSNSDSAQAAAIEMYIDALKSIQKSLKTPIILYIDEMHTLSKGQKNALKPYSEQVDGIRIIGSTTHDEFLMMVGKNAMRRRLTEVPVSELSEEETFDVLTRGWIKQIEARYRVRFPNEVIPVLIQLAPEIFPDIARPDSPIKFIQDLVIYASRNKMPGEKDYVLITEELAREYAGSVTGVPINPRDTRALVKYIEDGRKEIKERVIGQDHLVDLLVDTWMDVLTSDAKRAWRSVAVIGTTGTGKTLSAEKLADVFLKSQEKVLTIDCTAYSSGPHALNSLLGAPNGIISSDETKGILPEYLAGVGKRTGVIILNEFDKAHPDLAKKLMEMIDKGTLTGGDGQTYRLNRHLIVFTTNRGAHKIFNEKLGQLLTTEELQRRVKSITEAQARGYFTQSDSYAYLDEHKLPPEVVNRIDRWGIAKPITFEDALRIAELKAVSIAKENAKNHKLHMKVDKKLIEAITRVVFVQADGARPVEKKTESILARCRALAWGKLESVTDSQIRIVYEKHEDGKSRVVVLDDKTGTELASLPFEEPTRFMALQDPRFLETLIALEKNIKTEIHGQDEAMEQVAAAVRARANRPLDPNPLSIWLLGPTGVGKTETAKVLAKYLYGSPDRAQILNFGKINHMFELNDIFGPPRGVVGSESKAMFETILESFPEGTVIVFDELSNMGRGASSTEKDSLFKRLYEIFGEGRWTNAHGKTYDLSRFTFVLTGNDGEQLFQSLPNEELRNEIWEKNHDRDTLKELLLKAGLPEAFINRIDQLILMKSLPSSIRQKIITKFQNRSMSQLEFAHGVKIVFEQGFEEKIGQAFFPLGDGARGTERFVKTDLTAFIGDFLIHNRLQLQAAKTREIRVGVHLNFPERPWAVQDKIKLKATFKIAAVLDGNEKQPIEETKVIKPTSGPRLTTEVEGYRVAAHEAGHALVNEHLGRAYGSLRHLTIESAGNFGGYAGYRSEDNDDPMTLQRVLKVIAILAGGYKGQQAVGIMDRDAGWQADREMMNKLAHRAVVKFGLVEGLEFLPPEAKSEKSRLDTLDEATRAQVNAAAKRIVQAGIWLSEQIMQDPGVQKQQKAVIATLLEKGSVSGEQLVKSIGEYRMDKGLVEQFVTEAMSYAAPEEVETCVKQIVTE